MKYASEKNNILYDLEGADESIRDREIEGYKVKITKPGQMLEAELYPCYKHKSSASRAKKATTSIAQMAVNARNALLKLVRVIEHNFVMYRDFKGGLDFFDTPTVEEAQRRYQRFFRQMRELYKKHGLEFKYVYVPQWTTKTGRPSKHMHTHGIFTGGVPFEEVKALWPWGRVHADPLQPDKNGFIGAAIYIWEHLHGSRRWIGSRNLVVPESRYPKHRVTKRRAAKIAADYEAARDIFEKQHPGYAFVDMQVRHSSVVPGAYIYVRMRRIDADTIKPKRRE
ncbi:MAG TPA: hypothetical protein PKB13_09535 [Clostridia bacterium]|nr:hypothetical protein [Clostridia bacterium]